MKLDFAGLLSRLTGSAAAANFGWLGLDKILRLVVSVAVGTWVARYLGPAGYGTLNYGIAVAVLAAVVPALGLDAIVRRELVRAPAQAGALLGTTFRLRLLAGAVTYGVLWLTAWGFESDPQARLAIATAGVIVLQPAMLSVDLWFQSQLLAKRSVLAQTFGFVLCAALRIGGILAHAPLAWFLYVIALEALLGAALLYFGYRGGTGRHHWHWDGALARRLLGEAWPLAVGTLATLVYVRCDQILLRNLAGTAENGVYAAAARIMEILYALPLMLAASLGPGLVRQRASDRAAYERAMQRFFQLAAGSAWVVALLSAAAAPWLIPLAFGPQYTRAAGMFVVLAFSLPLVALGVARQEFLVNEGRQRFQLATTLVGAVVNVGLNLWAIPRWGGLGAAWVTLASHLAADLLTSLAWRPARTIGGWQLRALSGWWRLPARIA